jgi:hypothetical protein
MRPILALLLIALVLVSCRSRSSINVSVVYSTTWKLRGATLSEEDTSAVKRAAFVTLRRAFDGFAVNFVEAPTGDRTIQVEDTPYASNARERFVAAGLTYPLSTTSFVRIDVLFNNELAAVHCTDLGHCEKTRAEMLEGLGHGVGTTAAHELGHQLGFIVDTDCDDCFDSRAATSYAHFFEDQHWSDPVVSRMRQVLRRE